MDIISGMKKKPVIIVMLALVVMFFYLHLYPKMLLTTSTASHVNGAELDASTSNLKMSVRQPDVVVEKSQSITASKKEEVVWVGDPAQQQQMLKWSESRGWYDNGNNRDDYKTYSRDTLEQFANNGDLHALTLLVKGSRGIERKNLQTKAAVYGSTFALIGLMRTVLPSNVSSEIISNDQRHAMVLEGAAYAKVAEMRGELWPTFDDHLKDIEDHYYKKPLTDEDRQAIITIANNIYADLESQRMALGLGKFDNTYPPLVGAYYKAMGVFRE
jgi:hypothetical protein